MRFMGRSQRAALHDYCNGFEECPQKKLGCLSAAPSKAPAFTSCLSLKTLAAVYRSHSTRRRFRFYPNVTFLCLTWGKVKLAEVTRPSGGSNCWCAGKVPAGCRLMTVTS